MTETVAIELAGETYSVKRLTLRQSRALNIGVTRDRQDSGVNSFIDMAVEIIAVALSRDYPEMTADAILDSQITPNEIVAASNMIMDFSGFKKKESGSGEAVPGAASTGLT